MEKAEAYRFKNYLNDFDDTILLDLNYFKRK